VTRRESGAAAVEFALLLPIFVVLVFGIISAGIAFERWINVTQASRETARFAATYPVPSTGIDDWFVKIHDVAVESAGIDTSKPSTYFLCIRFINDAGPAPTPITQQKTWGTLSVPGATCNGSTLGDNRVEVKIQRAAEWNLIVTPGITISVTGGTTSRYEPGLL
jgi:Flp pilus assembly protein TadG